MDAEKDYSAAFEWLTALNRDLPEILIERQQYPAIRFGTIQECSIANAGEIRPCPGHIVTRLP